MSLRQKTFLLSVMVAGLALLELLLDNGKVVLNVEDEVIAGALVTGDPSGEG